LNDMANKSVVIVFSQFIFCDLNNGDREKWKCVRHVEQNIPLIFMTFSTVFLSKTDCSMAIGNILQHGRRIGIQCLRSLDRYTPNMEFNVHKRRLFHEELGKALVEPEMMRRETLSRTAAAKTAVERLRQESDQPYTSASTDTDRSEYLSAACEIKCTNTKLQYDREITCASHLGQFDQEDKSRKVNSRIRGGLSIYKE
ncbi:hypothetical protein T08_2929, partial [Trichinella sp. T8]